MKAIFPKLTLVGAGPGDPELISLKGIKALREADAVLYDALIHPDLLAYAPKHAIKEYVGKRAGKHSMPQDQINRLIVEHALKYGHVVRLKGGDPFVFGRGYEELEYARKFDIEMNVIPGISSATSLPGLLQIPLTRRGLNESFWVLTGTNKTLGLTHDLEIAAKSNATVIILMGFNKLPEIVALYQRLGLNDLPVAVIQNGSFQDQNVAIGSVDTIEVKVQKAGIGTPATIIVGQVVGLSKEQWLKESLEIIKRE